MNKALLPETSTRPAAAFTLFMVAIALVPLACRLPVGPLRLSITDCCLCAAFCLYLRPRLPRGPWQTSTALRAATPFLTAVVLSTMLASNQAKALQECVKLSLYLGIGTMAASWALAESENWQALRHALRAAIGLCGIACLTRGYLSSVTFAQWWGSPRTLLWCGLVFVSLRVAVRATPSGVMRGIDRTLVVFFLAAAVLFPFTAPRAGTQPVLADPGEPVAQQLREGYAALGVLGDKPLLGLGPGNYQEHIGEYYQGMPKENTMENGSQIGYCVLLASVGLIGLAGYLYWLCELGRTQAVASHGRAWITVLCALAIAGFFTPLLVAQLLFPGVLAHVFAETEGRRACEQASCS